VGHDAMRLDVEEPDAWDLTSMEFDKNPDAMEPDTGSEFLFHNLLVWTLLS
jgi:hypothetical protein